MCHQNYRNTTHGTFVGGLICWGAQLNPNLAASIDLHPCGIFDLQVIPNLDPDSGETDFLTEQELLQSLSTGAFAARESNQGLEPLARQ